MTYDTADQSLHGGQPIHLYKFTYQSTTYRWTSSDSDFFDGADTWTAIPIEPSRDLSISDNLEKSQVELSVDTNNPIAKLFRTSGIESSVSLFIYEVHNTGENPADVRLIHSGRILGRHVKLTGKKRVAVLKSEPLLTSFKRPAIREKSGKICPYVLYDEFTCKAVKNPVFGTVASISGINLVVTGADAESDGYFAGGYLETTEEKRMIVSHTSTSLVVHSNMQGLEVGDSVTMYIGCGHNTAECEDKFDNILNYGGEPFIPTKNPHSGRMV